MTEAARLPDPIKTRITQGRPRRRGRCRGLGDEIVRVGTSEAIDFDPCDVVGVEDRS
jgi:hypothetical protein